VKDIVVGPNSQAYVLTTESLYVLEGNLWRTLETLPDLAISLAVDPADAQTLYAGTVAYGAYRSTDGGMTWQAINEGLGWQPGVILRVSAVTIDETDSQHIALATAYGVGSQLAGGAVYENFDAGQRWTKLADSGNVVPYLVIQEGGVYVATDQGLVRYGDPLPPPAPVTGVDFGSLLHPTNGQMVILILTLLFAALALAGPGNWLPGHRRSMA
jgi:photosystem II stability/assembly factor-like uncharacterized protein